MQLTRPEGAARASTPYSAQQVRTRLGVHPSVLIEHAHDLANLPGWLDWGKGIVLGLHAYFGITEGLYVAPTSLDFGTNVDDTLEFDVGNRGTASLDWEVAFKSSWINLSETSGSLNPGDPDDTISVTIDTGAFGASSTPLEEHNCRLWGAISSSMPAGVIYNHLVSDPGSLKNLTNATENENGWSIAYYSNFGDTPTIERGIDPAYSDTTFDTTALFVDDTVNPQIAVAHVRNCSQGCCLDPVVPDPHYFYRDKDGKTWLFGHNGDVSQAALDTLLGDYLIANPLNGSDIPACITTPVDSEKYFLLILKYYEENGGRVEDAIIQAVNALYDEIPGTGETMNFIMSDGETIWAFRKGHDLALFHSQADGYSAVASEAPATQVGQYFRITPWLSLDLIPPLS